MAFLKKIQVKKLIKNTSKTTKLAFVIALVKLCSKVITFTLLNS